MSVQHPLIDLEGERIALRLMIAIPGENFTEPVPCFDSGGEDLVVRSETNPDTVFVGDITLPAETLVSYNGDFEAYVAQIIVQTSPFGAAEWPDFDVRNFDLKGKDS